MIRPRPTRRQAEMIEAIVFLGQWQMLPGPDGDRFVVLANALGISREEAEEQFVELYDFLEADLPLGGGRPS